MKKVMTTQRAGIVLALPAAPWLAAPIAVSAAVVRALGWPIAAAVGRTLRFESLKEYPAYIPHANLSEMHVAESAPTPLSPDLYAAQLAWQAFKHRGAGYITSGDLSAEDIDALGRIMRQLVAPRKKA